MMRYVVEKEKIAHNIRLLLQRAGDRAFYAVLKANGYGLGCVEMASICAENGVRRFAVTSVEDALALCASGIDMDELLMLAPAPRDAIAQLCALGVTFTVASEEDAQNLDGLSAKAHLKVDTGFGRRGLDVDGIERISRLYQEHPNIIFSGIYTHFADRGDTSIARHQFAAFQKLLLGLQQRGIQPGVCHCCTSDSAFGDDQMLLGGIRAGSALLGRVAGGQRFGLQRTGICQVPIEAVKTLPKGAAVGYGSIFHAKKEMQIAVCSIGTRHGFGIAVHCGKQDLSAGAGDLLRRLRNYLTGRNVSSAMVLGKRCPALGCISSEVTVLDVTGLCCRAGDIALFDPNPLQLQGVPVEFL